MQLYIIEISKYLIVLFMALYTLDSFLAISKKIEDENTFCFIRQYSYIFLVQFLVYLSLCLQTGNIDYLFFYAFLQIAIFATIVLFQMIYPNSNRLIVNNMCMLLSIGFMILCRLNFALAIKQFVIVVGSLVVCLLIPFFIHRMKFLRSLKWVYMLIGLGAILTVLILGKVTLGSKISYTVLGITVQPSEFVKIIFVFFVAAMLYKDRSFKNVVVTSIIAAAHILILVVSRDLGSALIFFVGYLFMLLVATKNYLYLIGGIISGVVACVASYYLFSHIRVRVQAFLDPFSSIDNSGYQIAQSLFAIVGGSWFGRGIMNGTPTDIPYVELDFIFSAIAEEFGVLFSISLILICLSCFVSFMKIALGIRDSFYQLIAVGISVMYIFQIFLTIGGGIKFIPLTGVTLPLVSYGGSSVLTTLIMFAIIQGLSMLEENERDYEGSYEIDETEKNREKKKK